MRRGSCHAEYVLTCQCSVRDPVPILILIFKLLQSLLQPAKSCFGIVETSCTQVHLLPTFSLPAVSGPSAALCLLSGCSLLDMLCGELLWGVKLLGLHETKGPVCLWAGKLPEHSKLGLVFVQFTVLCAYNFKLFVCIQGRRRSQSGCSTDRLTCQSVKLSN